MSGMCWIALELSIPEIGFNIMLSLTVKKLDAFKFDGVAESDNTDNETRTTFGPPSILFLKQKNSLIENRVDLSKTMI